MSSSRRIAAARKVAPEEAPPSDDTIPPPPASESCPGPLEEALDSAQDTMPTPPPESGIVGQVVIPPLKPLPQRDERSDGAPASTPASDADEGGEAK